MMDIYQLPDFLELPEEKRDEFLENVNLSTEVTAYITLEIISSGSIFESAPDNISDNLFITGTLFGIDLHDNIGISVLDLIHEAYRLYREHNYDIDKTKQALNAEYNLI